MVTTIGERVALSVTTNLEHGGRWTSLLGGDREWLWQRPEPRRDHVSTGDAFADAGGLEECIPTVRGIPDHGDAWSRPWRREGEFDLVECLDFALRRRITVSDGTVSAEYHLDAAPGYRFLWAAHALLDVSEQASLVIADTAPTRIFPEAAPFLAEPWPEGAPWISGVWSNPHGIELDRLGPDDGSAIGAAVGPWPDHAEVTVRDTAKSEGPNYLLRSSRNAPSAGKSEGPHHLPRSSRNAHSATGPLTLDTLHMTLHAEGQPTSIALWRNLGGFPETNPYRSIGVEPMLGCGFDIAQAGDQEAATVPASGQVSWSLQISAERVSA